MTTRGFNKWVANYMQNRMVKDNDGLFHFIFNEQDILNITKYLIEAYGLESQVRHIIITEDISKHPFLNDKGRKINQEFLGLYSHNLRAIFIKYNKNAVPFEVINTIYHELDHANVFRSLENICYLRSLGIMHEILLLNRQLNLLGEKAKDDYRICSEIDAKLQTIDNLTYRVSPIERYARINSYRKTLDVIKQMGLNNTVLYRHYLYKYDNALDEGYYQTKHYTLDPIHIFLINCYNNNLLDEAALTDLLMRINYLNHINKPKENQYLGLRYDIVKKSNENV